MKCIFFYRNLICFYFVKIVIAAGTGGTIGGTSHFLKEKNPGKINY